MNNEFLKKLDSDSLDWWLELLADNELDLNQRNEVLEFLDQNPTCWKKCAVALLNAQTLKTQLSSIHQMDVQTEIQSELSPLPARVASIEKLSRKDSKHTAGYKNYAQIAAALIIGISIGWFTLLLTKQNDNLPVDNLTDVTKTNLRSLDQAHDSIQPYDKERKVTYSELAKVVNAVRVAYEPLLAMRDLPKLVEVSNTEEEATYIVDRSSTDFLIEALILAGHDVSINQELVNVPSSDGKDRAFSLSELRIKKNRNIDVY